MIVGIGIDIIEINRVEKVMLKNGEFLDRIFTKNEIEYFNSRKNRPEVIAGNFAAKEAVIKALSVGLRCYEWKDVEILRDALGKPYVILHNNAKNLVSDNCIIHITISHCREYAVANAVVEALEKNEFHELNYITSEEIQNKY